jgi:hypothetical protein
MGREGSAAGLSWPPVRVDVPSGGRHICHYWGRFFVQPQAVSRPRRQPPGRYGILAVFCDSPGGRRLRSQGRPVTAVSGVHRAPWGRRRRLHSQRLPATAVSGVHRTLWGRRRRLHSQRRLATAVSGVHRALWGRHWRQRSRSACSAAAVTEVVEGVFGGV